MPRSVMNAKQVAEALHVSLREVLRLAEAGALRATRVRDEWQFRAGDVSNWIERNLRQLPAHRARDARIEPPSGQIIAQALRPEAVAVGLAAKTRASVLRELVALAARGDPTLDAAGLLEAVIERENRDSTALQDGVAIPHATRQVYAEGPVISAAHTAQGIAFGQRDGGLTDLFFLVCCPSHLGHLLHLGRLCRLMIDKRLQEALRAAADPEEFVAVLTEAERRLVEERTE